MAKRVGGVGLALPTSECPAPCLQLIKYGIVSEQVFLEDLHEWRTLYLSGRLHKPVLCPLCVCVCVCLYVHAWLCM